MRIKKFFESELQGPDGSMDIVNDISSNKVGEIIKELKSYQSSYQKSLTYLQSLERELSKYKKEKNKSNDQIDESVLSVQKIINSINQNIKPNIESVISNLDDYISNGRNYIL